MKTRNRNRMRMTIPPTKVSLSNAEIMDDLNYPAPTALRTPARRVSQRTRRR